MRNCTILRNSTADINEPGNIEQAWSEDHCIQWKEATDSEYDSLISNDTWELIPLPEGKNVVGNRWVFKVKRDANGSVERFKARLVVQGYSRAEGIDYHEVLSPVVRNTSTTTLLALANTCEGRFTKWMFIPRFYKVTLTKKFT